ncbi:ChaN family lipoprotein [bacterium SCSIO 12741]|nr:ChaN family lipoprotein [bacterium SCSIO 12741]
MSFRYFILLTVLGLSLSVNGQNDSSYTLFNGKGKLVTWQEMASDFQEADIILFGELHNNQTVHELELKLLQTVLKDYAPKVKVGAEMFITSQQTLMDEYLQGIITDSVFEHSTKLWPNYVTDYRPLLVEAKRANIPFYGTNTPRSYPRFAAYHGLDSLYTTLSDSDRQWLAPVPIELNYKAPGYKELLEQDFGSGHQMDTRKMVQAQALKDATMAHFLYSNWEEGEKFVHFHGDFHSKNGGGIAWYLKQFNKKLKVVIISSLESDENGFSKEWKKQGHYIFVVPTNSPKSY